MTDLTQTVDTYLSAWNEPDAQRRAALIDEAWADDGRLIDPPLAESGIIGTAIGLAMRGYRPICEIQFDGFVYPAFDQIVSQLAKMHYRSKGNVTLPVTIRIQSPKFFPGFASAHGWNNRSPRWSSLLSRSSTLIITA